MHISYLSHISLSLSLFVSLPMYIDNMFLHSCMSSWSLLDAFVWLAVIWHIFFHLSLEVLSTSYSDNFSPTLHQLRLCRLFWLKVRNRKRHCFEKFGWSNLLLKDLTLKASFISSSSKTPGGVWDDCCLDVGRVHQGFVNPHVLHSGRKSWEHWQLQTLVVHPATGQDSKFSAGHPQGGWHSFQTFYQPLGNMTKYAQIIPHKYPNTSYWSVQ